MTTCSVLRLRRGHFAGHLMLLVGISVQGCSSDDAARRQRDLRSAYTFAEVQSLAALDFVEGPGRAVMPGQLLTVDYIECLSDGTMFDNTYQRGSPFQFKLGAGQVIEGWEKGLLGARVGTVRLLHIPPQLAYDTAGAGGVIPPHAFLHYLVTIDSAS